MKKTMLLAGILSLWLCSTAAYAAFVSGSTGALGAFNPTADTVVTLPPDGILNYTTVNIPTGVTVTFAKNAVNTPVYMLATGDIVVAGTINVNGQSLTTADGTSPGKGGAGGYDGGYGGTAGLPGGKGLGAGGGVGGPNTSYYHGGGGGYASSGGSYGGGNAAGGGTYGNARIVPLIGGSGGGGGAGFSTSSGYGGSGGGGAILIASSGTINITGSVTANGGDAYIRYYNVSSEIFGGSGSGGAIRLIANTVSGNGFISAKGGTLGYPSKGGQGYIRLEAYTNNGITGTDPPFSYGLPGSVFVSNLPSLSITSIGGSSVPLNPTGNYNQPDILLPNTTTNPVAVNVSATNIPDGTTVTVWSMPQYGSATSINTTLSGSTASASINLSTTYSNVITAQATFTVVGMYYNGEEIDKVRVATKLGGGSETTYITKSGKEIKGELVAALMK